MSQNVCGSLAFISGHHLHPNEYNGNRTNFGNVVSDAEVLQIEFIHCQDETMQGDINQEFQFIWLDYKSNGHQVNQSTEIINWIADIEQKMGYTVPPTPMKKSIVGMARNAASMMKTLSYGFHPGLSSTTQQTPRVQGSYRDITERQRNYLDEVKTYNSNPYTYHEESLAKKQAHKK